MVDPDKASSCRKPTKPRVLHMATYPSKIEHRDHVHLLDGLAKTQKISSLIGLLELLEEIPERVIINADQPKR